MSVLHATAVLLAGSTFPGCWHYQLIIILMLALVAWVNVAVHDLPANTVQHCLLNALFHFCHGTQYRLSMFGLYQCLNTYVA